MTATKRKVKVKGKVETAALKGEIRRYGGVQPSQSASVASISKEMEIFTGDASA